MAAVAQVVNLVVLLFFVIVGATIEVLVSILLGALVCVIPLVVFAMFSPTSRSTPMARSLRQSPLTVLAVIVCGSGFMVMIGAGATVDLLGIVIGFILFIVGLVVLAPRLRAMQRVPGQYPQVGQPSMIPQQPAQGVPSGVYGEPSTVPFSSTNSPNAQFAAPLPQSPPNPPPSPMVLPPLIAERYCPACGAGNAKTAAFCQKCGSPLPIPS